LFYVFLLVDEAASVLLRDATTIAGIVKLVFTFEIRVSTTAAEECRKRMCKVQVQNLKFRHCCCCCWHFF